MSHIVKQRFTKNTIKIKFEISTLVGLQEKMSTLVSFLYKILEVQIASSFCTVLSNFAINSFFFIKSTKC